MVFIPQARCDDRAAAAWYVVVVLYNHVLPSLDMKVGKNCKRQKRLRDVASLLG